MTCFHANLITKHVISITSTKYSKQTSTPSHDSALWADPPTMQQQTTLQSSLPNTWRVLKGGYLISMMEKPDT